MAKKVQPDLERELRLCQAEKQATIAMLAGNLSHQLGTPLNVIRGRAEHLLRQQDNPARTIAALEKIIDQVDRIAGTLRVLLDLGGRRESIRECCDVREIIRGGAELMHSRADDAAVVFNLALGEEPLLVRCDRDQLEQAFVNLIENAIDAMRQHGGPLTITVHTGCAAEPRVRVSFEDRGCAVAPEVIPRLFDPFFAGGEPHASGAIGLAVAQSIVREHDGELGFEPRQQGSRFVVSLPLASSSFSRVPK